MRLFEGIRKKWKRVTGALWRRVSVYRKSGDRMGGDDGAGVAGGAFFRRIGGDRRLSVRDGVGVAAGFIGLLEEREVEVAVEEVGAAEAGDAGADDGEGGHGLGGGERRWAKGEGRGRNIRIKDEEDSCEAVGWMRTREKGGGVIGA